MQQPIIFWLFLALFHELFSVQWVDGWLCLTRISRLCEQWNPQWSALGKQRRWCQGCCCDCCDSFARIPGGRNMIVSPTRLQLQEGDTSHSKETKPFPGTELPQSLLYKEQEKLLISRGELEGQLMTQKQPTPIQTTQVVKGSGSSKARRGSGGVGFASGSSSSTTTTKAGRQRLKEQAKAYAQVLKEDGVVRIDNVLSDNTADEMRAFVYDMRLESEELIRKGEIKTIDRFADVLLKTNRCDMPIPLGSGLVSHALSEVLIQSPVGNLISLLLDESAVLYELSCLMSDPGSQRQVVHPDTPYNENNDDPVLYTCFIALQDITMDMGPTTWLPQTHTKEMHDIFQKDSKDEARGKDWLLQTQPSVLGTLPKGSCGIYDSRLLHCGGANHSDQSRALFYLSFKNPVMGYPGNPASIRKELIGQLTLKDLTDDLTRHAKGKPMLRLATLCS